MSPTRRQPPFVNQVAPWLKQAPDVDLLATLFHFAAGEGGPRADAQDLEAGGHSAPRATLTAQQRAFTGFRQLYNEERPHEFLEGGTPASRYRASPRPYTGALPPLGYPGHFLVKRITSAGTFRFKHRLLFLSRALEQHPIGLEEVDRFTVLPIFPVAQPGVDERSDARLADMWVLLQPGQEPLPVLLTRRAATGTGDEDAPGPSAAAPAREVVGFDRVTDENIPEGVEARVGERIRQRESHVEPHLLKLRNPELLAKAPLHRPCRLSVLVALCQLTRRMSRRRGA